MESDLYSTIEYSPGWYYQKFPGFWNVECYKILSEYSFHPEKYAPLEQVKEEGIEETKSNGNDVLEPEEQNEHLEQNKAKKRKLDSEI